MLDQAEALRQLVRAKTLSRPTHARAVAITSGKGGVGKTNLSANLAMCLSTMGARTVLLDGDMGMANLHMVLGVSAPYDIGYVLSGQKRLLDIVVPGPAGIQVLAGDSGRYDMANVSSYRLGALLQSFAELDHVCDFFLMDTGAGLGDSVVRLVLSAAEVVLVTTPEPTAIADAYGMVKVIALHSPGTRVHVVVNMVHREGEGKAVCDHFARAVHKFLNFDVHYLGEVPYDSMVRRAVQEQIPFVSAYPNSRVGRAVKELARRLMGVSTPTAGGIKGLFQRMLRTRI